MIDIIGILERVGAINGNGHFIGTSGLHLPTYINKDLLISNPKYSSEVGRLFADKFKNKKIDLVVAPAVAGIALSQWTAYYLSKGTKQEVLALFTEKDSDNNQIFRRGFDSLVKNKRVLIVEDITTIGSSVKRVISCTKKAGGRIVAVSVMVNKDPKRVNSKNLGVPFFPLTTLVIPSYKPQNCPMCRENIPIDNRLGHGNKK